MEVFELKVLKYAHFEAKEPYDREHVTSGMRRAKYKFKIGFLPAPDCETLSLNTEQDYGRISEIWSKRLEKEKLQMT